MRAASAAVALTVLIGVWAGAAGGALTNADVLDLTKAGVGEATIVAIGSSPSDFDVGVGALVALAEAGVGDTMIAAIVAARGAPHAAAAGGRGEAGGSPIPVAPGSVFQDRLSGGGRGPAMVVIPPGRFRMGCLSNADGCFGDDGPVHEVTIGAPFALSVHEVTFEEYDRFTYANRVDDEGWGRGRRPVINVSWNDAQDYVGWLSAQTGATYRLPSESEWEYAARAGTVTKYHWGNEIGTNRANCDGCGNEWDNRQTAPVASFRANAFGLHDMHGNVFEWVQDCWNGSYAGAPSDGSPWIAGDCTVRVLRGGCWLSVPWLLRAASRFWYAPGTRRGFYGFRVARTLAP